MGSCTVNSIYLRVASLQSKTLFQEGMLSDEKQDFQILKTMVTGEQQNRESRKWNP
jgi:hypothetical protein